MPDTASWIFHIAVVSRDDVNMRMADRLSRRGTAIHSDIEGIRIKPTPEFQSDRPD